MSQARPRSTKGTCGTEERKVSKIVSPNVRRILSASTSLCGQATIVSFTVFVITGALIAIIRFLLMDATAVWNSQPLYGQPFVAWVIVDDSCCCLFKFPPISPASTDLEFEYFFNTLVHTKLPSKRRVQKRVCLSVCPKTNTTQKRKCHIHHNSYRSD